jgi:hypothetical protein
MTLKELLGLFTDAVSSATGYAPDNYPEWRGPNAYETQKSDLLDLWAQIQPRIKSDKDQANFIDQKLAEVFLAFDEENDKAKGRQALCDIYNTQPRRLK